MPLTDVQLDALRELANIASGTAASALSRMLDREVALSVPRALVLDLADAVDACGNPGETVSGVMIGVVGDIEGVVLMLIGPVESRRLCSMVGVEWDGAETGDGASALCEMGNILGTSYLNGLAAVTSLQLRPCPPALRVDMLGAIVSSLLAATAGSSPQAFLLESELDVAAEPCAMTFLMLPTSGGIESLLAPLGLTDAD
jgi:chemotaxis protein CheC